ncbi:hypothetical protein jhhlp_007366 [Lomentospora prolificans]|uniref:Mid2 domain-containing protein n=1 Tax=Lomentospora prolificans TaxID=41688 RepID=A0A2N3N2H1_9PEZI|nr:hypothetical protein jhhlp_007366 [Lomentospora prolificans]
MLTLPAGVRALLLYALLTPTYAMPSRTLFLRQSTCPAEQVSCPSGVPENFCCPSAHKCISLAGETTVVCCPDGATCQQIEPIPCNLELQDVEKNPDAKIKTTALTSELAKCGNSCCPFGYTCNDQGRCIMGEDQSTPPPGASNGSPARTSTATTQSPSSTSTDSAEKNKDDDGEADEDKEDKAFPTTAVIVGVLLGVLGLVSVIVFLLIWRSKRRKQSAANAEKSSSVRHSKASSSFGNIISEPIINHDAFRTDFIRKPESSHSASLSGSDRLSRMFNRNRDSQVSPVSPSGSTTLPGSAGSNHGDVAPMGTAIPIPPIRTMSNARRTPKPVTPRMQREPSSESINIFAAPGTVERGNGRPLTQATTFTDMMDQAELGPIHKGKGYVPSPLNLAPRDNTSRDRSRWQ